MLSVISVYFKEHAIGLEPFQTDRYLKIQLIIQRQSNAFLAIHRLASSVETLTRFKKSLTYVMGDPTLSRNTRCSVCDETGHCAKEGRVGHFENLLSSQNKKPASNFKVF